MKLQRKTTDDWMREIDALTKMCKLLAPLSDAERRRILVFLWDKFVTHGGDA